MWNTGQTNPGLGLSPREHQVPWGRKAFPQDGSGVTMKIGPEDWIHFNAIDDEYHNVVEATLERDKNEPCGYRWDSHPHPRLKCGYKKSRRFNQIMDFPEPGIYHLVCPVEDNHEIMRMTVLATDDQNVIQAFEKAKQVDLARQGTAQTTLPPAQSPLPPAQSSSPAMLPSLLPTTAGGFSMASLFPSGKGFNFMNPHFVVGPLGGVVQPTQPTQAAQPSFFSSMFGGGQPSFLSQMFGGAPSAPPVPSALSQMFGGARTTPPANPFSQMFGGQSVRPTPPANPFSQMFGGQTPQKPVQMFGPPQKSALPKPMDEATDILNGI